MLLRFVRNLLLLALVAWITDSSTTRGEDADEVGRRAPYNLTAPTLGGWQLWTDVLVYHDWRIQRHCTTGHHRLLDDQNVRRAWGTYDDCRRRFEELRKSESLPPLGGRVVVALHGLGHSRTVLKSLADYLQSQGGYEVLCMSYASTRADLETHAAALAKVVSNLGEAQEINFVGHSLGNLVVRHYLADVTNEADGRRPDRRIRRMVMLGPPNQGAQLAEQLRNVPLFPQIVGPSGLQLADQWPRVSQHLATPTCEFGIVAGGRGDDRGVNPWVLGDDDLIVRVAETRLAGATDFRIVNCLHRQLLTDATVHKLTLRFLQHGYFESAQKRQAQPAQAATDGQDEPVSAVQPSPAGPRRP